MPQMLKILAADGTLHQQVVPDGVEVTPELVGQMAQQAGIKTVDPTPMQTGQSAAGGPPKTPQDVSVTGAFSKSAAAILRAVKDRTTDPLQTIATLDPKVGTVPRLAAVAELGGVAMAAPFAAAGAGVQAATEASGASPATARFAGAATELGAGVYDLARAGAKAASRAKALIQASRNGGIPVPTGYATTEAAGGAVQGALRDEFRAMNTDFGRQFDAIEGQIMKTTPKITPGSPGYAEAGQVLNYMDDAAASAGGRADAILGKMRDAIHPPPGQPQQPIDMADLVKLRKVLHERAGVANVFDPDASVVGKKAAEMRDLTMDSIRSALPDDIASQYDELRHAYRTQLVEPETFMKNITKDSTTPMQAFRGVFGTDDPHRLRVATEVLSNRPDALNKLRLGFAESLHDVLSNPEGASKAALSRLDAFQPLLESTGMFKGTDLADLRFLLQKNLIPSLLGELTSSARSSQVMLRGAVGASMATHLSSHPLSLAISAIAFGGIPQLRRAAMLPAGSMAQQRMAALIVRNIAAGVRALTADQPGRRYPEGVELGR